MLTKEEQEFEAWKKKNNYKPETVNEGFLDDDKEQTPVADSLTIGDTPEDKPDEENNEELVGDNTEEAGTDGGEEPDNAPAEEPVEDDGVSKSNNDVFNELKDLIANQNTMIQQMSDMLAKQKEEQEQEPETSDSSEFDDLDLGGGEEPAEGEGEGTEGEEPAEGEGTDDEGENTEGEGEGTEGEGTEGGDEGSSEGGEDAGEEEYSGDDESNDQKSEAYNFYMKHGKILNSNSGSAISILESGKLWKLDEHITTLAKFKLRQRIEERKREIRANILAASEGEDEE